MKFFFRIFFLSIVALVAAACAATSPTPTPTRGAVPTATPDTASAQNETDQAYVPSDVSLVANTGKPQFLDSYADW